MGRGVVALKLKLANKSATRYDGTDPLGKKIEVNARRITNENGSRQLSAIRGIGDQHLDYLAGVLMPPTLGRQPENEDDTCGAGGAGQCHSEQVRGCDRKCKAQDTR